MVDEELFCPTKFNRRFAGSDMIKIVSRPSHRSLLKSRIEQTVGVRFDPPRESGGFPVIVPKGPWEAVDEGFVDTICADWSDAMEIGDYLGFVKVRPIAQDRILTFMEWYFSPGNRDVPSCQSHEAEIALFETVCETDPIMGRPTFFGVARNPPGMEVTTIDRAIDWRVGLHIDNFDRAQIDERRSARNRISINVGSQRRHLLFVPHASREISDKVASRRDSAQSVPPPPGMEHMHLVWQFFQLFPETVIYRLGMNPGEGYVGPTENIIHDGSTLEMTKDDWQMVWLGHFTWPMVMTG
jgi:hypothetical protein